MEDCQAAQSWSSYLPEPHSACGHLSNHSSPTRLGRQKVIPVVGSPAGNAVMEEVRSCSSKRGRGQEETEDGLRQFKRQLTESFFNFMRSDQPKQMYDLTMALRRGLLREATDSRNVSLTSLVPVEFADSQPSVACQADGLHVASMRYPLLNEWEMSVELRQQVEERQSADRDSVRGRQEHEASKFVPRVSFSHRMNPDARRHAELMIEGGVEGGSLRMASPSHSIAGKMAGECSIQDLILVPWPRKDESILVQIRTLPPLCRSLNSMVSLRPRLLAGDDRRLEVYRLVDWPGLVSRTKFFSQECEADGNIVRAKELQYLAPFAPSEQTPFAGGKRNLGQNVVVQEGVKIMSDELVTLENASMKDDRRSFADPPLPSYLDLCPTSKLTDFLGGSQGRLIVVLDKDSCQEFLTSCMVPLLAGTSNSECLEASEVTWEVPQALAGSKWASGKSPRKRTVPHKLQSTCASTERICKRGCFSSSSLPLFFSFMWNTWVDKPLLASKENLPMIDCKSYSICSVKHQDLLPEIHNLLSSGSWLTGLSEAFFGQIGGYQDGPSTLGKDKISDPELKVSLFNEAMRNQCIATLLENVSKGGGRQIDVSRPALAPPHSPCNQAVEAYKDSGVESSKTYTEVKVQWEEPLHNCSYYEHGGTCCVWPEEMGDGTHKSSSDCPDRLRGFDSGRFVRVEVVSAVEFSQPLHTRARNERLEDTLVLQDSSGTGCSSYKEPRGHEKCSKISEAQIFDNRFILVGGIAVNAEAEAVSKDSAPPSRHYLPNQINVHGRRDRSHIEPTGVTPFPRAIRHKTPPRSMRRAAGKVYQEDEPPPQLVKNTASKIYYEEDEHGELRVLHDIVSLSSDASGGLPEKNNSQLRSTFNNSERPSISRPCLPGNGSKERQRQVQCPKWSNVNRQSYNRNMDHARASVDCMYAKGERDVQGSRDVQRIGDLQRGRNVRRVTNVQIVREVKRESDVKMEREVKRQREVKWEKDVTRERDVESSAPLLIVLSDSSDNDSEQRYRSSTARDQSAFQRRKQDNRMHRRLLGNNVSIADERQKRPKYEHQYDGDLYFRNAQNGFGTPSSGYHQVAEHDLKRPKPYKETPSTGRSERPVEKKQASNHPTRCVSDEGKWTAGITCDLCGRGPSLACGEWYAWCCGKMKSSCCCPPQRRTIKLPQKSKAVPRIVNGYVHRMCAIWSAEVVEQNDYMQDLSSAVRRGLSLKCAHCQKFGATMGCRVGKCRKSFHYPCADFLASRLQLRMWEGCSVAIACKEHQHIDSVCEAPTKLSAELRSATNLIPYLGSNLVCEDLSNNQEVVKIPCTNDVDDEPLPQVKYITLCRYNRTGGVMREGMCPGKAKLAKGCQGCTRYDLDDPYAPISVHLPKTRRRCTDLRTDWQHQPMHGRLAYDEFGRLQLGSEIIDVVECNVRCKCGDECKNRVLQNGLQVRLEVFRTKNRGWGVRTLDDLPRGTFVVEYVGELLTHDEADVRGQQYDAMNHSCLFNMDHPDVPQDEILVLDGYSMSNVARFINHSCDGNLVVCRVYTESIEPKFCRIALFTNRDIWAGTELCYDYSYNTKDMSKEDVQRVLRHPETIRCRCGSSNCRKVLWRGGS